VAHASSQRTSGEATEAPTARRLAEARRRGEVAFSRELSASAGLLAAVAVLAWEAPALVARAVAVLRASLGAAVAGGGPAAALELAGGLALRVLAPVLGAVTLVGLAVGLAQTRGLVLAPVRVDLGRVASAANWRRLLGGRAARECGQALLGSVVIVAAAVLVLRPVLGPVVVLTGTPAARLMETLGVLTGRLATRLAAVALALGALDALLVARRHGRGLRMTREEVQRETREAEGDPAHRRERRRLHRELGEQRMPGDVRRADLVVVDSQPIAVALRYDPAGDAAPVVVARGERLVAERIKQLAFQAGVPVFHDVGLAGSLGPLAEGAEIPPLLYESVAELFRALGRGAEWKRV
jgi:flagellar biosynthesis protein FlhB